MDSAKVISCTSWKLDGGNNRLSIASRIRLNTAAPVVADLRRILTTTPHAWSCFSLDSSSKFATEHSRAMDAKTLQGCSWPRAWVPVSIAAWATGHLSRSVWTSWAADLDTRPSLARITQPSAICSVMHITSARLATRSYIHVEHAHRPEAFRRASSHGRSSSGGRRHLTERDLSISGFVSDVTCYP